MAEKLATLASWVGAAEGQGGVGWGHSTVPPPSFPSFGPELVRRRGFFGKAATTVATAATVRMRTAKAATRSSGNDDARTDDAVGSDVDVGPTAAHSLIRNGKCGLGPCFKPK